MEIDDFYTEHWKQIEDDRFARYEKMFVWSEGQLKLLEPADIQSGHNVGFRVWAGFFVLRSIWSSWRNWNGPWCGH